MRRLSAACLALLLFPAHATAVVQPAARLAGEVRGRPAPASDGLRQMELGRRAGWVRFQARHPGWRAVWNERTGAVAMASGPPIALGGGAADARASDVGIRRFLASHPDLFGAAAGDLVLSRALRRNQVWYLSYHREIGGVRVLFEDWEFRVNLRGGLMTFRAAVPRHELGASAQQRLGADVARERARGAVGGNATSAGTAGTLRFVPRPGPAGTTLRLAYEEYVHTETPPGRWVVWVDAENGEVLERLDRVRYGFDGSVTGMVHLDLPTGPLVQVPFPHQGVKVGPDSVHTDGSGGYSSPVVGTQAVDFRMRGRFGSVLLQNGGINANASAVASSPATVDQLWSAADSQDDERDGYYHLNLVHDWIKARDPGFTGNDYPMPCRVSILNTCNAFWDGYGMGFFIEGGGCANTASMPDVVYHEYGHAVNDNLATQEGAPIGMANGALHEGLADVLAAFVQDNPIMGKGFRGPGTSIRNVDNTRRWPQDQSSDPHETGLIVAGALWDLREALGLPLAAQLMQDARYGLPDDFYDDGVAMSEFFVETLVADDNDGDLSNGTPNAGAIITAFNLHGIGTGYYLQIIHVFGGDVPTPGPYPVIVQMLSAAPIGGIAPSTARIHFSVNGSPYASMPMTPTPGGGAYGEYGVNLPVVEGSIVRYYFSVEDTFGESRRLPEVAPEDEFTTLLGATSTYLVHDHESNAGWTVGYPGDGASSGFWAWAEPIGTDFGGLVVQPDVNHTPYGILCYVTGNALVGQAPGTNDVDDGATSVVTGLLDATAAGPEPVIEYYRWYSNHIGNAPRTDTWRVYVADDGIHWVPVETTTYGQSGWKRVAFFLTDYVAVTNTLRVRFVAEDLDPGSLVEAAVDDLRILRFDTIALDVPAPPAAITAFAVHPNPSAGDVRFRLGLGHPGPARLHLYDVAGRRVRTLVDGDLTAGAHTVIWDGRDDAGRPVPSGLYLAGIESGGSTWRLRVARMR